MNFFALRRYKKLYRNHSKHVDSFDFSKMPQKIKREFTNEELKLIFQLPFIRLDDPRTLLVNERPENDAMLELLTGLDSLQDILLFELYNMYKEKCADVALDKFQTKDLNETYLRLAMLVLPEVLWAHGHDIPSKLF